VPLGYKRAKRLPHRMPADLELPDQVGLRRDHSAGTVLSCLNAGAQGIADLSVQRWRAGGPHQHEA